MNTNQNLILRNIYGKQILMPIKYNSASNDPIFFNEVATIIWNNVVFSKDRDELLKKVLLECNFNNDSSEQFAVKDFIEQLIDMKLILE